jgi:predicted nucleic acid-binding protein
MGDTIILDTNVLKQIASGNQPAADALLRYLKNGTPVYMSRAGYGELVTRAKSSQMGGQYREILSDLRIQIAANGTMADRINLIADNIELQPAPNAPGQLTEYKKKDPNKPGDAFVAAQAKAINAKLWTLDKDFKTRAPQFGVQLAPECQIASVNTPERENPDSARQMLGLNPKPIGSNGQPLAPGASPGGGSPGTYSLEGVADNTVPDFVGPSPKGQAIVGGIQIALEGVNFILNLINDYIQRKKVNDAMDRVRADIAKARAENPRLGVLLLFYYIQAEALDDSPIKPGANFEYLLWGLGVTSDEAQQDALKLGSISRGTGLYDRKFSQEVWIPPIHKTSITTAKCPFPPVAIGRFFLGNSNKVDFQLVEFDIVGGFDDIVEKTIELPPNTNADFAILNPPSEVYWYNLNGKQKVNVPLKDAKTANGNTIKVVDLDPWLPFNAMAAMVFPVTDWTEHVFDVVSPTTNFFALSAYVNFKMIRWIRAENIHLLRFL